MKIVRLQSENVKRLVAVEITPDGQVVTIKGQNGAGKSSVLDSIAYALGGEKLHAPKVIREGQKKARVVVDLGDYVVERKWTASGSTLSVKSHAGATFPSPQKLLDGIVGKLSFDPFAFTMQEPKKQAEMLRQLVGLDLSTFENKRKALFEQRTIVNRDVEVLAGSVARMPEIPESVKPVDVAALLGEADAIQAEIRNFEQDRRDVVATESDAQHALGDILVAERRVQELEQELDDARRVLASARAKAEKLAALRDATKLAVAKREDPSPKLAAIREKLKTAETVNAQVRARQAREAEEQRLTEKRMQSAALTSKIGAIEEAKASALASVTFPVPGLSFGEEGVTFHGLPLEQASQAEKLRVSIAIAAAANPKLKVVLVRDGSLLDNRSLALLAELAEHYGLQVWLEKVGDSGEVGILIEDGHVAGVGPAAEADTAEAPGAPAHA